MSGSYPGLPVILAGINLISSDLLVLGLTVLLFAVGLKSGRYGALLALPGVGAVVLFMAYYLHIVDDIRYYQWRSHPIVDLAPALFGLSMGWLTAQVMAREESKTTAVVAGALIALLTVGAAFARPWLRPLPRDQLGETWKDGICLQSTMRTCGPCTAATILHHLGHPTTERDLAEAARTDGGGTLNWLLIRAIREQGFTADFRQPASVMGVKAPAILGVGIGEVGHFIALLSVEGETLHIGEPLEGALTLSLGEFTERYDFEHFAIEISPSGP